MSASNAHEDRLEALGRDNDMTNTAALTRGGTRGRPTDGKKNTGGVTRLSVNIPSDAAALLKEIAAKHSISVTDAVRRALALLQFIEGANDRNAMVLLKEKDSDILREIVLVQ